MKADLHDAEVSDAGLYGALRNKDRDAVGGATAQLGIGPHSESAIQRHLREQGLAPTCAAGVLATRKFDSCECMEDPSRRSEEHRQEFLKQTALQDSILQLQATCRAMQDDVQIKRSAVDNVPALFAVVNAYNSESPPKSPLGA